MKGVLVDYNAREFIRPGVQSTAILETMNADLNDTWRPSIGEKVLLVEHDGCEYEGEVGRGKLYEWVADIEV